jgi:hypothetical protein
MNDMVSIFIACAFAGVIMVRSICVVYQSYYKDHKKGAIHFAGFGYSYVAFGAAAASALIYLITGNATYSNISIWAFLVGNAGMILFDRRSR